MSSPSEHPEVEVIPAEGPYRPGGEERGREVPPDISKLARESGVMLISAGVVGFVLPGPGTPAIIAGGMILWPKKFVKAGVWLRRSFPTLHRGGMRHIRRFLDDLERRYAGSVR